MTEENIPGISAKQTLLIVDDAPENLDILKSILMPQYHVKVAVNGIMALKIARTYRPDLILLDIVMPQPDGYEVLRQLKADPGCADIPVIFITAKTEAEYEMKGLEMGAMDYIHKPFLNAVVQARVKTHLRLIKALKELEQNNEALRLAAVQREEVERITQHDLKGPLNVIINQPQLLLESENLSETGIKRVQSIEKAGYKMLDMINRSLDMYRMEIGTYRLHPRSFDIVGIIRHVFTEFETSSQYISRKGKIFMHGKPCGETCEIRVNGEELLCYSMLSNLIRNAFEAMRDAQQAEVRVELDEIKKENKIRIRIINQMAVPEEMRDIFFNKFSTLGKLGGTGLGTYSAKLCADTQGGSIAMDCPDADKTRITIELPAGA